MKHLKNIKQKGVSSLKCFNIFLVFHVNFVQTNGRIRIQIRIWFRVINSYCILLIYFIIFLHSEVKNFLILFCFIISSVLYVGVKEAFSYKTNLSCVPIPIYFKIVQLGWLGC